MRFALLLVAAILIVGSFGQKFYMDMFVHSRDDEDLKYGTYYLELEAKQQQNGVPIMDRKYPVTGGPVSPLAPSAFDDVGPRNSFIVPKNKRRWGRELSNPFVGK